MTDSAPNRTPKNIALIGFDGAQSLDLSGPADVFNAVNEIRPQSAPAYHLLVASPGGGDVRTTSGLYVSRTLRIDDLPCDLDTIIISGGSEQALLDCRLTNLPNWLKTRASQTRRIASVCTGAFILAYTGLLTGRRATTHWYGCDRLQQLWPNITVNPDAIFVADPPFYTSAGVTAGIDLCLAFVEQDYGADMANQVARRLVTFMRRPGGQAQFSTALQVQTASTPAINRLLAEIADNPGGDLRVSAMADRVGMTERTFVRKFSQETGQSPARHVQQMRLERAKSLLQSSNWPLARIADKSGFGSLHSLHRAFIDSIGITPGDYRSRFGSTLSKHRDEPSRIPDDKR